MKLIAHCAFCAHGIYATGSSPVQKQKETGSLQQLYKYLLALSYIKIIFQNLKISNLANCYNACLFKLFKFVFTLKELDETYNFLQGYNLCAFQHRVVLRLSFFAHKIINIKQAPINLKNQIIYNSDRKIDYKLLETTKTTLCLPMIKNHYGELTFKYFINLFLEKICIKIINLSFIDFSKIYFK